MTDERWKFLMSLEGLDAFLTEQEIKEGWHFCSEMDGLLANRNEPDGDCFCELNKSRKY
jgi:hypothetical protein